MMVVRKHCVCCGEVFAPDRRIGARQKTCSAECRKALKRANSERFKRKNPGYWSGRYELVKEWRKEHPDYQRQWRQRRRERRRTMKPGEIQTEMFSKALDALEENVMVLREIQTEMPFQLFDIKGRFAVSPVRTG